MAHLDGWHALPTQGVVLHNGVPEHIHVEVTGRTIQRIEYRFRAEGRRNRASGQYLNVLRDQNAVFQLDEMMNGGCSALTG